MAQANIYKPRYTIAYTAKSKVWPYKNSYLRRFYALRARRVQRGGLFRRCVLVATTRKWTQARRFFRPFRQAAGSKTMSSPGKTAYGRPVKRRYRYRSSFYMKQQLRFFHGKIKEETFRRFFRTHISSNGTRAQSFFSSLESRLDRIFFRRRLLPTIYSCHQFIHHYGVELNSKLEYSPRANVAVGDRVSIPASAWKPFYWDLFCRVYYRRWGLYVRRRRLLNKLKKKLFIKKSQYPAYKLGLSSLKGPSIQARGNVYKNFVRVTKKRAYAPVKQLKTTHSASIKSFLSRLSGFVNPFSLVAAKPLKSKFGFNPKAYLTSPGIITRSRIKATQFRLYRKKNYALQMKNLLKRMQKHFAVGSETLPLTFLPHRSFFSSLYVPKNVVENKASFRGRSTTRINKGSSKIAYFAQSKGYRDRLYMYSQRITQYGLRLYGQESISEGKGELFHQAELILKKLRYFQKLYLSLRVRKTLVPQVVRFQKQFNSVKFNSKEGSSHDSYKKSSIYRRPYLRKRLLRFYSKRHKKISRAQQFPRLKPVHFFIPAYLQRDFRTLSAVKIQSPGQEEIYYPFRISLAQIHSFYRSQGF